MVTRRAFLRTAGGLAGTLVAGAWPRTARADPVQSIQALIDDYARSSLSSHRANVGVVAGVVTADNAARNGQLLYAGRDTLTNPNGRRLELNERTPFEIASISKVFTSGIHYMLHGPYDGTLGSWLGGKLTMSRAVADTSLKNLAVYEPGFPQDNRGGAYPPATMMNLRSLFDYMATFTPPFPQGSCYSYSNTGWSLLGDGGAQARQHRYASFRAHLQRKAHAVLPRLRRDRHAGLPPGYQAAPADGLHPHVRAAAAEPQLSADPASRVTAQAASSATAPI